MTSIDDLFKQPGLSSKRKLEVSHDPNHFYKSAKLTPNGDAKGKSHATIEDDAEGDDTEAGPALPPDDEEDYGRQDEEGRFFGGGVDRREMAALDYLDEREAQDTFKEEKYDAAWVRKLGVSFEKKISKNADLRAKYEEEPQKFMVSEADLDDEIKRISILSQHPELYQDFVKIGCVESLVTLLSHENPDIAISAMEVMKDMLDENVDATDEQWNAVAKAALDADLLGSLLGNFDRLNEEEQTDRDGVLQGLNVLESLVSQSTTSERVAKDRKILEWLLGRIQKHIEPVTENTQTAAEVLSVLVQANTTSRIVLAEIDAVDVMLQLLARYRHKDPEKDSEEEEFFENLFDCLACLVDEPLGKAKFIDAEGVELALIMVREGELSKVRALKLLDHAVSGSSGKGVCEKLVDAEGLKPIFKLIAKKEKEPEITEHVLDILAALLRNLPDLSPSRGRLMVKFQDNSYAAVETMVKLRSRYAPRVQAVEAEIKQERQALNKNQQAEMEIDWLTRRLDAGLSVLQTLDTVLAWLVVEDARAKKKIRKLLKEQGSRIEDVRKTLKAQRKGIEDEGKEAQASKEMLGALVALLKE
jgi:beta-catenin-like protein 1